MEEMAQFGVALANNHPGHIKVKSYYDATSIAI
jgi:hypothetical protein